ncbi:MAG: PAS domain S-box protein [Desulfobacterales bacterium]
MMIKENKSLKGRGSQLEQSLKKAKEGAEYYKNIAIAAGKKHLRRIDQLSKLITERKIAEEALKKSEHKYRFLFDHAPVGIFEIDLPTGKFINVNAVMCETLGYSKEEFLNVKAVDLLIGDSKKQYKHRLEKLLADETISKDVDYNVKTKDGREIWVSLTVNHFFESRILKGALFVIHDVTDRKEMEKKLLKAREELEQRVEEHTAELVSANKQLKQEAIEREIAKKELKKREQKLELQTGELEEINTALRVLLEKRNEDKIEIEDRVLLNINEMILPYLEKLRKSSLNVLQKSYVDILESNLNEITSQFYQKMSSNYYHLTPKEIQIAGLIKQGKTTKEIAELIQSSPRAIEFHRNNLRKKFGLTNTKTNLMTHLLTLN